MKKYNFVVFYDNLVTDDIIRKYYNNMTYEEVFDMAMKESHESRYISSGNFEIYVQADQIFD